MFLIKQIDVFHIKWSISINDVEKILKNVEKWGIL